MSELLNKAYIEAALGNQIHEFCGKEHNVGELFKLPRAIYVVIPPK